MDKISIIFGLFIVAVFALAAVWHIRQNSRLEIEIRKKTDANTARWMSRFAWSRTLQLFAALGLAFLVFIGYSKQLADSRAGIDALNQLIAARNQTIKQQADQIKRIPPKQQPVVVAAPKPAPAPAPQAPQETGNGATLDALYNPEKKQTDRQSALDDIKKRYEDLIVLHLFLKKCNKTQPADYPIISRALTHEMAGVHAPMKLHDDIAAAAQGSYNEIYAKSSCDGKSIEALHSQYVDYIKMLAAKFK